MLPDGVQPDKEQVGKPVPPNSKPPFVTRPAFAASPNATRKAATASIDTTVFHLRLCARTRAIYNPPGLYRLSLAEIVTRISMLASWPGVDYTSNRLFGAAFFVLSIPSNSSGPRRGPSLAPVGAQGPGSASSQAVSQTPIRPLPPSAGLLPCRGLSGPHRQRRDPAHHAPEQPPRQVALRQHQPVVPRVLVS